MIRDKKYPKLTVSVPLVGSLPILNKRFVEVQVQVFQTIYIEWPHVQIVLVPKDAIILINGIGFHVKFKRVLGLRQCHGLGKPCHGRYPGFRSPPKLHIFLISPSLFDIWPVKSNIFLVASPIFFIICSNRGMNHSLLSAYRIRWVRCIRIQTEPYLNSNSEQIHVWTLLSQVGGNFLESLPVPVCYIRLYDKKSFFSVEIVPFQGRLKAS